MKEFAALKTEVYELVRKNSGTLKADLRGWTKFFFYSIGVIFLYCLIMFSSFSGPWMFALLTALAFMMMGLMMNVLHDVMHGGFSENPFFRNYFCYYSDLIGASSLIWKNKHNNSHHTYTNNALVDNDLNVSSVLRFTDQHEWRTVNRYQHLYILPAYAIHTPFWFYVSDFKNVFRKKITTHRLIGWNKKERLFFYLFKIVHITLALIIPISIFGLKDALLGYAYIYSLVGLLLALIFQVAHVFEGAEYHDREKFDSIDEWVKVQIESSTVFAHGSKFAFWCYGGLNYQTVHHLFPEISHIHYSSIYPLVKKYCEENKIRFIEFSSLFEAVKSHLRQIYLLGINNKGIEA